VDAGLRRHDGMVAIGSHLLNVIPTKVGIHASFMARSRPVEPIPSAVTHLETGVGAGLRRHDGMGRLG